MKALLITVAAGISASLLASAVYATDIDANKYSSKAALIGQRTQAIANLTVASAAIEQSARYALLSGHPVTTTEAPPVQLVSYNTKTVVRGTQPVSVELAPLK